MKIIHQNARHDSLKPQSISPSRLFCQFLFIITSILWNFSAENLLFFSKIRITVRFEKFRMFPRAISFRIFCPNFHESRPKIPAILPMTLPYPFIIFPDHKSLLKFTESLGLVFLSYLLIEFSQWRRWRLVLVVRAQFFLTICWNQIDQWALRISPTPN